MTVSRLNEHRGFNIDEETVDLLDALLVGIATDDQLREEFKKLNFIKSLQERNTNGDGPFRALLNKVMVVEQEQQIINIDHKRMVSDLDNIINILRDRLEPKSSMEEMILKKKGMKTYYGKY